MISNVEFSTEADYDQAVENYIKQLAETHNQEVSKDKHYHEKTKLAFDNNSRWANTLLQTLFLEIMFGWMLDNILRPRARLELNG